MASATKVYSLDALYQFIKGGSQLAYFIFGSNQYGEISFAQGNSFSCCLYQPQADQQ